MDAKTQKNNELQRQRMQASWMLFADSYANSTLSRDTSAAGIDKIARKVEDYAKSQQEEFESGLTPLIQAGQIKDMDCRKGCSHCCNTVVWATVPEVVRVYNLIKGDRNAEEIRGIKKRLAAYKDKAAKFKEDPSRANLPTCGMLELDSCSVYGHRPLWCRGWNSTDVSKCIEQKDNPGEPVAIPQRPFHIDLYMSLAYGIASGLNRNGLKGAVVDFNLTLLHMIDNPESIDAWSAGEDAFAIYRPDETEASA